MEMNWLESTLYGLFSGLMDILPVSAPAHRVLLLKFFGTQDEGYLLHLLIHLGIFSALYYSTQSHLLRMRRARALSRIPKKKRKRPLDVNSMMDWSLLKTIAVPVILGLFFYKKASVIGSNLILVSLFLFVNGVILYLPQFFPTGNRDSRTLSRVEGLLMGLGGAVSVVPGISAMGVTTAIGSLCGVEETYGLNMALMMNLVLTAGFIVLDIIGMAEHGLGTISVLILLRYLLTALAAFVGTLLGVRCMRRVSDTRGYGLFAIYCWGLALFTFILNLMA